MDSNFQELSTLQSDMIAFLKAHSLYETNFSCIFFIKIKPEKHKDWIEQLEKCIPKTKSEKGCLIYEVSQDLQDPTLFGVYEKWANGPALEQHFHSAHTKEYLASFEHIVVDVKSNVMRPL